MVLLKLFGHSEDQLKKVYFLEIGGQGSCHDIVQEYQIGVFQNFFHYL